MEEPKIVFVLGAPGGGKGTQCAKIVETYGWTHLSAGDLLRNEVAAGSELGLQAQEIMQRGEMVPTSLVLDLIISAMQNTGGSAFLIDGFPRKLDQLLEFEAKIKPCDGVLVFTVPDDVAIMRLMQRGQSSGRADDNEETIKKRMEVFKEESQPVIEALKENGRNVAEIGAGESVDYVFGEVRKFMNALVQEEEMQPEPEVTQQDENAGDPKAAEQEEAAEAAPLEQEDGEQDATEQERDVPTDTVPTEADVTPEPQTAEQEDDEKEAINAEDALDQDGERQGAVEQEDASDEPQAPEQESQQEDGQEVMPAEAQQEEEQQEVPAAGEEVDQEQAQDYSEKQLQAVVTLQAAGRGMLDRKMVKQMKAGMGQEEEDMQQQQREEEGQTQPAEDGQGQQEGAAEEGQQEQQAEPDAEDAGDMSQYTEEQLQAVVKLQAAGRGMLDRKMVKQLQAEKAGGEEQQEPGDAAPEQQGHALPGSRSGSRPVSAVQQQAALGSRPASALQQEAVQGSRPASALQQQPAPGSRPTSALPQETLIGSRPASALQQQEAAGSRPASVLQQQGAAQGSRPASALPQEAVSGSRPASALPQEAVPGSRPASALPQVAVPNSRPASTLPQEAVSGSRPTSALPLNGSRPASALPQEAVPGSRPASALPREAVPGSRPASTLPQEAVPGSRPASALPHEAVPGSRPASALPQEAVLGSRPASALPQEAVNGSRPASALPQEAVNGSRPASALPQEEVPGSRPASALPLEAVNGSRPASALPQEAVNGSRPASALPQEAVNGSRPASALPQEAVNGSRPASALPQEALNGSRPASALQQQAAPGSCPGSSLQQQVAGSRPASVMQQQAAEQVGAAGSRIGTTQQQVPASAAGSRPGTSVVLHLDYSEDEIRAAIKIQAAGRGMLDRKMIRESMKGSRVGMATDAPATGSRLATPTQRPLSAVAETASLEQLTASVKSLLVVCGPSGVGKGTLIGRLMQDHPDRFVFSVSHTTRAPRPGEQDGISYHFTSHEAMQQQIEAGYFLEYAHVHGNIYGTSLQGVADVSRSGRVAVLDIDVQGAEKVKASAAGSRATFIFIAPPSLEELEARLRGRGTESEEKVLLRLHNASEEMERSNEPGLFNAIVVNDNVEQAYMDLKHKIAELIPGTFAADELQAEPRVTMSSKPATPQLSKPSTPLNGTRPVLEEEEPVTPKPTSKPSTPQAQVLPVPPPGSKPSTPLRNGTGGSKPSTPQQSAMSSSRPSSKPSTPIAAHAVAPVQPPAAFSAPPGGVRNLPIKALPVRQYMDQTVVPILREGLRSLNDSRPADPLQFLADYLLAARAKRHDSS